MVAWLVGYTVIVFAGRQLAIYKGRHPERWTALTFFFGLLALFILALMPNVRPPARLGTSALAGELAHLSALHTAGILSDDEFAQAKVRLLTP